jgi:putative transposase
MMLPKGYSQSKTSVHFMNYHFVWCPKYRRKVIVGNVERRLKELLKQKATELGCSIIALETMPDHVHIFVRAPPTVAPNRLVAAMKGYTSNVLRKEFRELTTRMPTLWTRSYFVSTHGHVSADAIKKYVEAQKGV